MILDNRYVIIDSLGVAVCALGHTSQSTTHRKRKARFYGVKAGKTLARLKIRDRRALQGLLGGNRGGGEGLSSCSPARNGMQTVMPSAAVQGMKCFEIMFYSLIDLAI